MNKDKVYVQGYVVGFSADTMGHNELIVKLPNMDVVEIDENLVYRKLDEPQKPVVPQFAGDFIAEQKKLGHTLSYSIDACMSDRVGEWYWDNSELFAQAWIFGYKIEQEKKYFVKINNVFKNVSYLNHSLTNKRWIFADSLETDGCKTKHTRKELEEAGFEWVFDCPGIEIEEVE